MASRIVVAGSVAQRYGRGGHTWVFLQYLLGFRQLGYDVLFVDRLEPEMCVDQSGELCPVDKSGNLSYLLDVLRTFGLERNFAILCDGGTHVIGMSRAQLIDWVKSSALLLNVMGFLNDEEILSQAPHRVLLDIDPGFGQIWQAAGLHELFRAHDRYVTIGENIGRPDCAIPGCGQEWVTTPQPVVLEHWPKQPARGTKFTTVASWRGPFAPLEFHGQTFGLRVHEFRKFLDLPKVTGHEFELALDIDAADHSDLAALKASNWQLADPGTVAADPIRYQQFIQESKAEFMVAKNMYVQSASGWMSDRSICYLASGKPVLAQDTGIGYRYPVGAGLLTFTTLEEAAAGVEEICADYDHHARAARDLAEAYFDSRLVLSRLLDRLGVA